VTEHKTSEQGPAMIALSPEIHTMLKSFIQMCKRIPGFDTDNDRGIFVSWPKADGTVVPMTSSHINKSIQRIWQQGPIDKHISATRLRKATSTAVRAAVPEARETLAKHMTHSPATADRHYALFSQREIAMPMANLISSVMEKPCHGRPSRELLAIENAQKKQDTLQANSQVKQLYHENIPTSKDGDKAHTAEDLREGEKEEESDNDSNKTLVYDETDEGPTCSIDVHKRRTFTTQEAEQLLILCQQNIQEHKLCKKDITETLESTEEGRMFVETIKKKSQMKGRNVWKPICDRLRLQVRKQKK